jgi:uncharacterized membrane protein
MLIILLVVSINVASATELQYRIDSVELNVYRDGLVHVTQAATMNETYPSISFRLLSPSIENVLVLDENQTLLEYQIDGSNITLYSLGAKKVLLEYDTLLLTEKDAGVWTLILNVSYDLTVYLPEKSTIVHLNKIPSSIDTKDEKISLTLFPGEWEISYVFPIALQAIFKASDLTVTPTEVVANTEIAISATVSNVGEVEGSYNVVLMINQVVEDSKVVTLERGASTTVQFTVSMQDSGAYTIDVAGLESEFTVKEAPPFPVSTEIVIVVLMIVCSGFVLWRVAPGAGKIFNSRPYLRQEDQEVIQFISQKGGKVFEAEIREEFPDLPRTSMWRLVRRLEKMELVTVEKIRLQNQIKLRK